MSTAADVTVIEVSPVWQPGDAAALWQATVEGRVICARARRPLFEAARALIAEGADPAGLITMRHAGKDAPSFFPIRLRHAAGMTTEERGHPVRPLRSISPAGGTRCAAGRAGGGRRV